MHKLNSSKPVFFKEKIINLPIAFVDLFILNPTNFKKWIPKIGRSKNKFDEIRIKDILQTRINAKVEDHAFLLDVSFGKETHEIMIKKPTLNSGLDFIITKGDDFKFEANIKLASISKEQTKISVEVHLLEAKHFFHPITSLELKIFFGILLSNFVKECEKNYKVTNPEERTIECFLLSFYTDNLKQFDSLISPIKHDLGEGELKKIEERFKILAFNSYEKLNKILESLGDSLPSINMNLLLIKIAFFIEEHILMIKNIVSSSRAETLNNLNKFTALQLENIEIKVAELLKGVNSKKVKRIEDSLNDFLLSIVTEINDIVKEIKSKIPPQHFKDFELGVLNIVKTDLESTKSLLNKFELSSKVLTENEKNILNNLIETVNKYEDIISKQDTNAFSAVLDMSEKSLDNFVSFLNTTSDNFSVERIEIAKDLAIISTREAYDSLAKTLAKMSPEHLAENEALVDEKISTILERYANIIKIVSPNSTKEKIENMKAKIEKTLKDEYSSFCLKSK